MLTTISGYVLLCVSMLSGQISLADDERMDPKQEPHQCHQCHTEQTFSEMLQESNCSSCHQDHVPIAKLALADATQQIKTSPTTEKKLGMSVPLYSSISRIGSHANSMVNVPGGEFIRGTNMRFPDEGPQYVAAVAAFQIDIYEVTNFQYKKFIDASQHKSPKHFENRTFPEGKADHPVVFVSWYDAKDYCEWAGKRLPTDIEWEKAARGTDGRTYAWGSDFKIEMANTPQRWATLKTEGDTTPVGAFPQGKSVYGLFDVSGNVWEWTASWYQAYPGNTRRVENYGEIYKTLKGGSWWDCSFYKCGISAPLFNRSFFYRKTKNKSFGFRCAKDI